MQKKHTGIFYLQKNVTTILSLCWQETGCSENVSGKIKAQQLSVKPEF